MPGFLVVRVAELWSIANTIGAIVLVTLIVASAWVVVRLTRD